MDAASLIAPGVFSVASYDARCRDLLFSLMVYRADTLDCVYRIDGSHRLRVDEKVRDVADLESYGRLYAIELLRDAATTTTEGFIV